MKYFICMLSGKNISVLRWLHLESKHAYFLFQKGRRYLLTRLRMMVKEIHVEGLEAYKKAVNENKGKTIFALFSGSTDADGKSWCPDCVTGG